MLYKNLTKLFSRVSSTVVYKATLLFIINSNRHTHTLHEDEKPQLLDLFMDMYFTVHLKV